MERCVVFVQTLMSVSLPGHKAGLLVGLSSMLMLSMVSVLNRLSSLIMLCRLNLVSRHGLLCRSLASGPELFLQDGHNVLLRSATLLM